MKKLELDVWGCCTSKDCIYRKECANHSSASEIRIEDGFSPKLIRIGDQIFCDTYDTPPLKEFERGCYDLPKNINELNSGFVDILTIEDSLNYHI